MSCSAPTPSPRCAAEKALVDAGYTVLKERPRSRSELLAQVGELQADNERLAADLVAADRNAAALLERIAQLRTEVDHYLMRLRHADRSARVQRDMLAAAMKAGN